MLVRDSKSRCTSDSTLTVNCYRDTTLWMSCTTYIYSYMRHDSLIYENMTHSYVQHTYKRHGSFICETNIQETWLIHMWNTHTRDMAHSYVQHTYKRHGSYICETHIQETWLILLTFVIVCCHRESNPQSSSHPAAVYTTALPVCCVMTTLRNFFIYWGDWLLIKFCENDSFRKLFLFFENIFQYLGGISQDISVSHFDSRRSLRCGKSTAIYLADSFCQLYSSLWSAWQEDPNDPQQRCTMARRSCARLEEIKFSCEFAICSQYQNVEETEI